MQTIRVESVSEVQRANGSQFITVTLRGPDGVAILKMTTQATTELMSLLSDLLQ